MMEFVWENLYFDDQELENAWKMAWKSLYFGDQEVE